MIYHYPRTNRPGSTDQSEIEATKNASRLGLPIFTVIKIGGTRNVRLSRVTLWDDEQEVFLVEFEDEWRTVWHFELDTADDENPSERVSRKMRTTRTTARDSRFSLRIKRAYGLGCAVCEQRIPSLIQGAHLISHSDGGKDAVGNGLPLCANHHLAMDNQLWAVNPQTFDLTFNIPKEKLGITRDSNAHLDRMLDSKCLEYVWDKFHAQLRNETCHFEQHYLVAMVYTSQQRLPDRCARCCSPLRSTSMDELLYIGQSNNLRRRILELRGAIQDSEMPWNDPHVAAARFWALLQNANHESEICCSHNPDVIARKSLESLAISFMS